MKQWSESEVAWQPQALRATAAVRAWRCLALPVVALFPPAYTRCCCTCCVTPRPRSHLSHSPCQSVQPAPSGEQPSLLPVLLAEPASPPARRVQCQVPECGQWICSSMASSYNFRHR